MKAILTLAAMLGSGVLAFADNPFSSIAKLPESKLIGVDKYGLPAIAEKDKATVAKIATSSESRRDLRSLAIWGLAISGYSPESVDGLLAVVQDKAMGNDRETAAMGLRNFTMDLPVGTKEELRAKLRDMVKTEGLSAPDEIIRALIAWDDAPWVADQFGEGLAGNAMEIDILQGLPPARATARLLEIYKKSPLDGFPETYSRRFDVGLALTKFGDKRGVDILDTLLDAASLPRDCSPQCRHNAFAIIQKAVGKRFGYERDRYDPAIDGAIMQFREWWFGNRYEFELPKR